MKHQKTRRIIFLWMIMIILILTACTRQETPQTSSGILYEIVGGNAGAYLYGTIHVGHEDMYPLDEQVESSYRESEVLGLEIDVTETDQMEISGVMSEYAVLDDGRQMTDIISQDLFDRVMEVLSASGYDEETMLRFEPWFAARLINEIGSQNSDLSAEYGVENYLIAQDEDKEIISIETIEDQISPYDELSDESQELLLENALIEMNQSDDQTNELLEFWREGNIEAFTFVRESLIQNAETESLRRFQEALLDVRDAQMAAVIDEILQSDDERTHFFAVGAMHVVGENSIVQHLTERGYLLNLIE